MRDRRQFRLLELFGGLALAGVVGCGCGGSSPGDAGNGDSGFVVTCQKDPRVTPYTDGVSATSPDGQMKVAFLSANPAAPAPFVVNAWTVKITDGAGNPLPNLELIARSIPPNQTLYMPDMGHGANAPYVDGGPGGVYEYSEADLIMPGIWQVTFTADGGETAQIDFCVAD